MTITKENKYLNRNNHFLQEIINSIDDGIILLNPDFTIDIMNLGFINMFGYTQDQIFNKSIEILFNPGEYKILQSYFEKAEYPLQIATRKKIELYGLKQDKTTIYLEICINKIIDNKIYKYIIIMEDIGRSINSTDDLKYLAYYDQLTKLPNRTLFLDRAEVALRIARREKYKLAVIYIDIDDFKIINDTMGHNGGDIILKEISLRFKDSVRDSDTVCRVGGDEFTILMLNIDSIMDAAIVAKRILQSNKLPIKINDQYVEIKTSIGVSIFPKDGKNIDILLEKADAAMYYAKENGKNLFEFYNSNMNDQLSTS